MPELTTLIIQVGSPSPLSTLLINFGPAGRDGGSEDDAVDVAFAIHNAPPLSTPADNDELGRVDSTDGYTLKRWTWGAMKTAMTAHSETLFAPLAHVNDVGNPHEVTKAQVGLSEVDNTSDADKPVSTATLAALAGKASSVHVHDMSDVTGLAAALALAAPFYSCESFGALPTANASQNVAAVQAALDAAHAAGGGTVKLDQPGTYEVDSTLRIYSYTDFLLGPGVVFKKVAEYGEFLANDGAWTLINDDRIRVVGLVLDANNTSDIEAIQPGLRGHVSWYNITNVRMERCRIYNGGTAQFSVHCCAFYNAFFDDMDFPDGKAGIQTGSGQNLYVRNIRGDTFDDLLALNAHDWPVSSPKTGDLSNVVIENMITRSQHRIMAGSWTTWAATTYSAGDRVVSSGNVYIACLPVNTSAASTVAPTHTAGIVTGADGIPWRWEYAGTNTETNVHNITYRDCRFYSQGVLMDSNNDMGGYYRMVVPGTEGNSCVDGVTFENCIFDPDTPGAVLLSGQSRYTRAVFRNCTFKGANIGAIISHTPYTVPTSYVSAHTAVVDFTDCLFHNTAWIAGIISNLKGNFTTILTGQGNRMSALAFISGSINRVDGFDLPVRVDHITAPVSGDRARLRLTSGAILPGLATYRRGRWVPVDADQLGPANRRLMMCNATTFTSGSAAAAGTIYPGGALHLTAGSAAIGWAMGRLQQVGTYQSEDGTNFNAPFVLPLTITGQAIDGGVIRVLHGAPLALNTGFTANAAGPAYTSRGIGIEIGREGGTGNQKARIIAHDGTSYRQSAWLDLGVAPGRNNVFSFELLNRGNGTVELYWGRPTSGNLSGSIIGETAGVSISNGPTGVGANAATWAVATADNSTVPVNANSIRAVIYPTSLEYLAF